MEVDQAICDVYITEQARLPGHSLYTASAFTISAGGDTFTLPASVTQWTGNDGAAEYEGDVRIQLVSDGTFLRRVPRDTIEALKDGQQVPSTSRPSLFALYPGSDQVVNGLCYPGAREAEACNLYRILMADDPRDFVGSGTDDLDDVELQMSRLATTALTLMVSAELVDKMLDEDLKARRINPQITKSWRHRAEVAFYQEKCVRQKLKMAGYFERRIA